MHAKVSGKAASHTVIAHLRKATLGEADLANTHPFQFGPCLCPQWQHQNFEKYRQPLLDLIPPGMARFILGETDSELIFFIILSEMQRRFPLQGTVDVGEVAKAVSCAIKKITAIVGMYNPEDGPPTETYLTFVLSNGGALLAHQGGKPLHYSTYKKACSDRDTCPSYGPVCEAPSEDGRINHLISSQEIPGENVCCD